MISQTSSLAASDIWPRHDGTGHMKNSPIRQSKQEMTEKKMFGSKFGKHGKGLQIGKKFKMKGAKDTSMKGIGMHMKGSISPHPEEFEKMLKSSVTFNPNKKRSFFSQKKFG